jgi:hypothetical protein
MAEPTENQNDEKAQAQRYVAELLRQSMTEVITVQTGTLTVLFTQGKAYEEKAGRIVQLQALNEGRVDVAGVTYVINSATVSKSAPMTYDFCMEKADGSGEVLKLLLDYVTVRRMVERKTAAFDPSYVDDLFDRLNDMHEDAFSINGKEYYIAGEEWTQTIPDHRDLILIPVGRTDGRNVTMSVPEALIEEMIETKRTSICFPQPDNATLTVEPTPDPAGR